MAENDKQPVKVHCNDCGHQTKHLVLAVREQHGEDEIDSVGPLSWNMKFEMLECCGCDAIVLRRTFDFSEDPEPRITYFPPLVSRRMPVWVSKLDWNFRFLIEEVYQALHADSRRLAMMGAGTLLDMVIRDKVGDKGPFEAGLDALENQGYVSKLNRDFLEAALEGRHAAAHRGHQPKAADVNTAMDIIENLLQAVYVLAPAAAELKKFTPPRTPGVSTKKKLPPAKS